MKIRELFVPAGLPNHPSRNMEAISSITIHTTGNRNRNATANAHAILQYNGGGGRQASWHYSVDADEVWQSFKDSAICWHTGTRLGNESSIGIEICVNDQPRFRKACKLAAQLTAFLLKRHRLGVVNVLKHQHWNGKNCPAELLSGEWGVDWREFKTMVLEQRELLMSASSWAREAWEWGIVNGITDGTSPKAKPTREQVLQLLYNYDRHSKSK